MKKDFNRAPKRSSTSEKPANRSSFSKNKSESTGKNRFSNNNMSEDKKSSFSERRTSSDKPRFEKRTEGSERPARPYNSDKPRFEKRTEGSERPARPYNSDKPRFEKRTEGSERPARPYNSDKPRFEKRTEGSERPARPYNSDRPRFEKKDGDSSERPSRPYNSDRPRFEKRDGDSSERPSRPYNSDRPRFERKDGDSSERPSRPYNSDRPRFEKRDGDSSERPSRPYNSDRPRFEKRDGDSSERPSRPYNSDRPRFEKRDGDSSERPSRPYNSDKPRFEKKDVEKRSYKDSKGSFQSGTKVGSSYSSVNENDANSQDGGNDFAEKRKSFRDTPTENTPRAKRDFEGQGYGGERKERSFSNDTSRENTGFERKKRDYSDASVFEGGNDTYKRPARNTEDRPRREFNADSPRPERKFERSTEDRPRREFNADSPRPERKFERNTEDRPRREFNADSPRPERKFERNTEDRPRREFNADSPRPERTERRPERRDSGGQRDRKPRRDELPRKDFDAKKTEKNTNKAPSLENPNGIRLNRFIANAGVCSRRDADDLIKAGAITVNGEVVTEMGLLVKKSDVVTYKGQQLFSEPVTYVLLNKPKDFITTTDDPLERKTVMSLVEGATESRIYPVGRLDRNTTGVLLLTNDGELATKLTHPSHKVQKIYRAELDKRISKDHLEKIINGFELEDGPVAVNNIAVLTEDGKTVGLEIHMGRNRIVRRIFEHFGYVVEKLDRTSFAGLTKESLSRGQWRKLTTNEVIRLKFFTSKL